MSRLAIPGSPGGKHCWFSCGRRCRPGTPRWCTRCRGGAGHVLITSRAQGWSETAVPVDVDVLARAESVALLVSRMPALSPADADEVAAALGDLPLALAQAAGYMTATGMPAAEYLGLL